MEPFRPFARRASTLSYYEVPVEVLEDREAVLQWAGKALEAAQRSGRK